MYVRINKRFIISQSLPHWLHHIAILQHIYEKDEATSIIKRNIPHRCHAWFKCSSAHSPLLTNTTSPAELSTCLDNSWISWKNVHGYIDGGGRHVAWSCMLIAATSMYFEYMFTIIMDYMKQEQCTYEKRNLYLECITHIILISYL